MTFQGFSSFKNMLPEFWYETENVIMEGVFKDRVKICIYPY
jgi:hypothetical protein